MSTSSLKGTALISGASRAIGAVCAETRASVTPLQADLKYEAWSTGFGPFDAARI
jgi:hypothetical protein